MEKVKEDYEIIIREINKGREVKDVGFSLNTSQSGEASHTTEVINGELDAFIINTLNPIQIEVSLDGYENIVLFEMQNFSGEHYLPIRVNGVSRKGEDFVNTQEKLVLNDKLRFEVKGPFNSDIDIKVRYR